MAMVTSKSYIVGTLWDLTDKQYNNNNNNRKKQQREVDSQKDSKTYIEILNERPFQAVCDLYVYEF